jgi:hypothetical protein
MNPQSELERRVEDLEKELRELKRAIQITPTRVNITRSVTVQGLLNGDRVYTKQSGQFQELSP